MEVPATVRQALGKCATSIALRDVDKADPDQLLRMVLLSDGCHKLQVIYRSCDLLDLETLNTQLGHSYAPLPETARRIIRLRTDPNSVMADLVDIVESDPSLAAQVISWASSSFYAAPGRVNSVYDAISRVLGFDMVMNLAMGLSLDWVLHNFGTLPLRASIKFIARCSGQHVNALTPY